MPEDRQYWAKAIQLLRAGQAKEAERVIRKAMAPRGDPWELQCAALYESRAAELHTQGDDVLSLKAARRARKFMVEAGNQATSSADALGIAHECARIDEHLRDMLGNY